MTRNYPGASCITTKLRLREYPRDRHGELLNDTEEHSVLIRDSPISRRCLLSITERGRRKLSAC